MLLKKIFYTIVLLSIIRIGNFVPIVDINQSYLYESLKTMFTKPIIKNINVQNKQDDELKSYLTSKINVLNTE